MDLKNISFDDSVEKKKLLHDGEEVVKKITFMGILRNSENYLNNFFFKMADVIERIYDVEFEYYFLENNSIDNTRNVLIDWIQDKQGRVFLSNDKSDYEKTTHGINHSRTKYLGDLRNKLVNNVGQLNSKWTFIVDSDIFFSAKNIEEFFECKPKSNGYCMVSPYTEELFNKSVIAKEDRQDIKDNALLSINHYFDTFALFDKDRKSFYPNCPFAKCKMCQKKALGTDRTRISEDEKVVEVSSCGGGIFLISSDALNDRRIRWSSYSYETNMDLSLCEHVTFCDRLKTITEKKIVILQDLKLYRIPVR